MTETTWTWTRIRETFLQFFAQRGHTVVPSSSLVPAGDPTLLFTNAGMVQFKNVFLGLEQRPYDRAVTVQKCLRVSGHHNDLEAVGPSPRHHTFFLMCGNFAFGAYFKREAIRYAWELVTQVYGLPPERLYFTVFEGDEQAVQAWRELGIPSERIFRMGEKTNFWMMGDVGPVGPTSELHYDWGPAYCTCGRPDCSVALDNDCGRWLEIWNLVFMQYDQGPDGRRTPLPRPGVDTGMGLERMAAVLQQRYSNFDTDLFAPLLARIRTLLGHSAEEMQEAIVAYRVMADHARAAAFLIADGVMPGNEGRAYVLRMIIRRAVRYGRRVGLERPFLSEVADAVVQAMGAVYPELEQRREFIRRTVIAEEERFGQTLAVGLQRLDEAIAELRRTRQVILPGSVVFRLYDTFGFPVEMTRDIAREQGLAVDEAGFQEAMARQRERARAASGFSGEEAAAARLLADLPETTFLGYRAYQARARVLALLRGGTRVDEVSQGEEVDVVLDRTPFYPEGGGQVGDTGRIAHRRGEVTVTDTQRVGEGVIVHRGRLVRGTVRVGDGVRAVIDRGRRRDIMRNHTATHLLHRALHEVLGEHARQAGSLVAPERLRFDFTHLSALTPEERAAVEQRVNEKVLEALRVRPRWMPYQEALRRGAMALFGEKYGERVRVVEIDGYSRELCGGTHLSDTGQVGLFKIVAEGSAAAGIRRIEAVTGRGAMEYLRAQEGALREVAELLRVAPADVVSAVRKLQDRLRQLERERATLSPEEVRRLVEEAPQIGTVKVVIYRKDNLSHEALRRVGDRVRDLAPSAVAVLGSESDGKANLVIMVGPEAAAQGIEAVALARQVAPIVGGSGGGNATLAQAGGRDPSRLPQALEEARAQVAALLAARR
ncbi:MAG: alanine--tRNA ligase [Armatimonadota bacterium]|nr:alanine--tRNA ligase [Armatimonadota bacterium]